MRTHFDPNNMNVLTLERQRSQSTPVNGGLQLPQSRGSTASLNSAHSSQQASQQQLHQQSQMTSVPLTPIAPTSGTFQAINNTYQGMDMGALQQYAQISTQDGTYLIPGQHPHMATMGPQTSQSQQSAVYYSGSQMAYNPHAQGMAAYPESHMAPQTAPHLASALEEDRKRKAANANAANDRELREMLRINESRQLPDVAREVIANERTAKAEKTKQLFAMLWLKSSCRSAKTSVPRGRVYATYVSRCGNERVQPLNPASFGKLVRVIFPGIQTRRLGVRGESKYHYVDLALVDDAQDSVETIKQRNASISMAMPLEVKNHLPAVENKPEQINFSSIPRLTADTAILGDDSPIASPTLATPTSVQAEGRAFIDHVTPGFHTPGVSTANSYEQALIFSMNTRDSDSHIIELPDIWAYASPKMDIDAANTLVALYRSHCTSLIDSVRFCKEKQFFRLFTTLSGALTVPVQKLFLHPNIAAWIRECDWMMYQKMLQCVAPLTLQVVPPIVVKFLDTVSRNLHAHIRKTFASLPKHTLEAKLEPATLFSSLLHRMNRVNQTAHAAANVLESADLRDQMWNDWVRLVNPKRIMESELPNCGFEEVYRILTKDIRAILQPSTVDPVAEAGTHYQGTAGPAPLYAGLDTVVDRLHCFVETLPSRFPNATARRLMTCISNLGSAALRDITINGGPSFNCWWLTKVFLDEMSHWLAAFGGFMEHQHTSAANKAMQISPSIGVNGAADVTLSGAEDESRSHSRYSSVDLSASAVQLPRPGAAPRQPSPLREPTVIEIDDSQTSQNQHDEASPSQQLLAGNGVNGTVSQQPQQSSHLHHTGSATHLADEQLTILEQHPDLISQDHSELPAELQLEIELQKQIRQMEARDASRNVGNFDDANGMSFSTSSFESLMSTQPMQQPQAQQMQMMDVTVHDDNIDDSGICMTFNEDRMEMKDATDNLLNSNRKRKRVASAAVHGQEQRASKR